MKRLGKASELSVRGASSKSGERKPGRGKEKLRKCRRRAVVMADGAGRTETRLEMLLALSWGD